MATSYATQLDSVQAAIAAIEAGAQSYSIATGTGSSRSVTSADLKTLYDREKWLRKMADRESNGGMRVRGVIPQR